MSKATNIRALIEAHRGQFFSVTFQKLDGTMRTYSNAQRCYKKGHDGVATVTANPIMMPIVENLGNGEYQHRALNLSTVKKMRISGVEYTFE